MPKHPALLSLAIVVPLAVSHSAFAASAVRIVKTISPQIIYACSTAEGGSCGTGAYISDGVYNFNAQVSVDSAGPTDQEVAEINFVAGAGFDVVRTITLIPDPDGPGPGRARLEGPIVEVVVELLQAEAIVAEATAIPSSYQVARVYGGSWGSDLAGTSALFDTLVSQENSVRQLPMSPAQRSYEREFLEPASAEIDTPGQIPSDFNLWADFEPPYALDYSQPAEFEQSISDVLRVSFRLRAESRASGSISTNGGEAIACSGRESDRSFFTLNDEIECGKDVQVRVTARVLGMASQDVSNAPEVAGPIAGAAVLGALGWVARRRQRSRRNGALRLVQVHSDGTVRRVGRQTPPSP